MRERESVCVREREREREERERERGERERERERERAGERDGETESLAAITMPPLLHFRKTRTRPKHPKTKKTRFKMERERPIES